MHNLIQPGTYATELDRTLAAQGLPAIVAPDNQTSGNLMNMKLSDLFCEEDKDVAMQLQQQLLQQQQRTTETKQKRTATRKPSMDRAPAPEQTWKKPNRKERAVEGEW